MGQNFLWENSAKGLNGSILDPNKGHGSVGTDSAAPWK